MNKNVIICCNTQFYVVILHIEPIIKKKKNKNDYDIVNKIKTENIIICKIIDMGNNLYFQLTVNFFHCVIDIMIICCWYQRNNQYNTNEY